MIATSTATQSALSVTSSRVVTQAGAFGGSASEVQGHDANGTFDLSLVWQAVPRTYVSRLNWVTLNGSPIGAARQALLERELGQAASSAANSRWATDLRNIALELGEYQPAKLGA